jgi:hypothetical protein
MLISQNIPFDRFETKPPLSSSALQPEHYASEPYTLTLEAQASMTFAPVCIQKPCNLNMATLNTQDGLHVTKLPSWDKP